MSKMALSKECMRFSYHEMFLSRIYVSLMPKYSIIEGLCGIPMADDDWIDNLRGILVSGQVFIQRMGSFALLDGR